MRFDLVRFLRTAQKPFEQKELMDLSSRDFPGYSAENPVDVEFQANIEGERVRVILNVSVVINSCCARCLQPVSQQFSFESSYLLKEEEILSEEPELPIEKGFLDVEELVYQDMVMELPQVLLCSKDCLGLCPVCGKRKEAGHACNSSNEETPADPRLSILKQLLN